MVWTNVVVYSTIVCSDCKGQGMELDHSAARRMTLGPTIVDEDEQNLLASGIANQPTGSQIP